MFRLGERVRLDLPEPWASAVVEVDTVVSRVIALRAVALASAYLSSDGDNEGGAMIALYEYVTSEARPSWDFVDHRGPIARNVSGFVRLPVELALAIVDRWTDTYFEAERLAAEAKAAGPDGGGLTRGLSDEEIAEALDGG